MFNRLYRLLSISMRNIEKHLANWGAVWENDSPI